MATTQNTYTGNGSLTEYSFTFPYLEESDVKVSLDGVVKTQTTDYTFANATTISFNTAPASGVAIRIYRDTDIDELKSTFFAGSSIRAQDLNKNLEQNNFAVQEIKNYTWDNETDTIHSDETWVSSDTQIATTAAMDARFQDEVAETIRSDETWVENDDTIPTTLAAAVQFDTLVQTGIPSGSGYPVGKTWLQNDTEKTVSIWDGAAWVAVASGGAFTTLPKVVYVDAVNGNDSLQGHRISNPKRTIKAAIEQINAETDEIGDGSVVIVAPGVYQEIAPIDIQKKNVSIIGQALRSCIVHPTPATEENTLFRLNSGSYVANLTLTGVKASGTRGGNSLDTDATYGLPTNQGWNFAFYPGATIVKSPYIANCTNFSDSEIDNSDLNAFNPRGGLGGDTDSAPTGGGILIDGSVVNSSSPLRSMVCDSYTHVGLDGPGIFVTNNGYCQATSSYAFFTHYHIKTLNGGQANLAASTSDFGRYGLIASGKSSTNIFTASSVGTTAQNSTTIIIGAPSADSSWYGSATRPQSNMLLQVGGNPDGTGGTIYSIIGSTANGSGWDVEISNPDPTNLSNNLGFSSAVPDSTTIRFFLRSMIASSGHTMEYVGSGTNYSALPENGGVPVEANEIVNLNNGKVWAATTNHQGKFTVGDTFSVDQVTGYVNISNGAIGIEQLIENLDLNGFTLSDSTGDVTIDDTLDMNSNNIINVSGLTMDGNITMNAQSDVRFADSDSSNYVAIQGPATVGTNYTLTLPNSVGNAGEALITDANGNLSWSSSASTVVDQIIEGDTKIEAVDTGSNGELQFTTDGTRAMTVDNNQRVGIGTTSPVSALNVSVADGGNLTISATNDSHTSGLAFGDTSSNTSGRVSYDHFSNAMRFDTAGNERVRIDSSGNVGVGTSSPANYANFVTIALADTSGAEVDFIKGSTVQGSVYNAGDVFYIESKSTVPTAFVTNGSERVRIDSSGNVGINTTAPGALLDVTGSNGKMLIANGTASNSMRLIAQNASGTGNAALVFQSWNLEYGRFDTSARLLVGTSSTLPQGEVVQGAGSNESLGLMRFRNDSAGPEINLYKTRATSVAHSVVSSGDYLGSVNFRGSDGANYLLGARIDAVVDGTPGTNDMPGRLVFFTTADGASSPTERLRIASTGAVGLSGANYGSAGDVLTSQGSGAAPQWAPVSTTPAGTVISVAMNSAPTGYIKCNGAAVSRTTYADLFAAIGTQFGAGDGSSTFNLPDLRGEFIRGWDDGRGVDSGRTFGSSQAQATQNLDGTTSLLTVYGGNVEYQFTNTDVDTNVTETRPRNIALLACIKY